MSQKSGEKVLHGTDEQFAELLQSGKTIVVDFWAPWCGPCRIMGPIFEELASEIEDVIFVKLNVDETHAGHRYDVMSIPTVMLFEGGEPVASRVGVSSLGQLRDWVRGSQVTNKDPAMA